MLSKMFAPADMASSLVRSVASTVDTLLNDPTTEYAEQDSDRMGGTISVNTGMPQQAIVKPRTAFDPVDSYQDQAAAQNYSPMTGALNPMRLVNLKNAEWLVSSVYGEDVMSISLPQDFYPTASFPARGQTRYFKYIRAGFDITINFAAALGVAGLAVVYYVPDGLDMSMRDIRSVFNLPHSIVNLATTSSARLTVPYVNRSNYARVDTSDCGKVIVTILTPLTVPSGLTPVVTLSAWGAMMEMDLQNPVPQGRSMVDIAPGPGNLSISNGVPLQGAQSLALEGEQVSLDRASVGVSRAFENLRSLAQVPGGFGAMPVGSWSVAEAVGDVVYTSTVVFDLCPNMKFLSSMYSLMRGSIVLRFLFASTQFNKGRVRITYYPNETSLITLDQAQNGISIIHELGLNTTAELVIPYAGADYYTRPSKFTGRVTMHVVNRLQANVNAPSVVNFYVTLAGGPDIEFAAPHSGFLEWQGVEESVITGDGNQLANAAGVSTLENTGGEPTPKQVSPALINVKNVGPVRPSIVESDHMDVNVLSGRGTFLGVFESTGSTVRVPIVPTRVGLGAFWKLFGFFSGEYTLHFYNDSAVHTLVAHSYTHEVGDTILDMTALGAALILPRATMSLKVPYYSSQPQRLLNPTAQSTGMLGALYFSNSAAHVDARPSRLAVYISYSGDNFSFPLPVPLPLLPFADEVEEILNQGVDEVSELQNRQNTGEVTDLDYLFSHEGPTNQREHICKVRLTARGLGYTAKASAKTKKLAKRLAATKVLNVMAAHHFDVENQGIPNPLTMIGNAATTTVDFISKLLGCIKRCISAVAHEAIYQLLKAVGELFVYLALVISGHMSAAAAVAVLAVRALPDSFGALSDSCEFAGEVLRSLLDYDISGAYAKLIGAMRKGLSLPVGDIFYDRARKEASWLYNYMFPAGQTTSDAVVQQGYGWKDLMAAASVAKTMEFWIKLVPRFIEMIREHFDPSATAQAVAELGARAHDMALACQKGHDFAMNKFKPEHEITLAEAAAIGEVYQRLLAYRDLAVVANDRTIASMLTNVIREIDAYFKTKQVINPGEQARLEPIGVLMQGPPGSGKSSFQQSLMAQVAGLTGLPRTAYTENINDDYYSGYSGQTFHIKDEFLAGRDEKDGLRTVSEISTTSYSLPMAHLADKGMKYTSKFVIAQTNHREHDITVSTLHDSKALMRRFPYRIKVEAHEDYKKGGFLDRAKAESNANGGLPAVITGRCWKPVSGNLPRVIPSTVTDGVEHIDMIALCRQIADEYRERLGVHNKANNIYEQAYAAASELEHQGPSTLAPMQCLLTNAITTLGEILPAKDAGDPSSELDDVAVAPLASNGKKYLDYVTKAMSTAAAFIAAHKEKIAMFVMAMGTVGAAVTVAIKTCKSVVSESEEHGDDEGRAYSGSGPKVKRVKNTRPVRTDRQAVKQGGDSNQEYSHLWNFVGHITSPSGVSRPFITLAGKTIMLYAHAFSMTDHESDGYISAGSHLHYLGRKWPLDDYDIEIRPEVVGKGPNEAFTERIFVTIPKLPIQFKDSRAHHALPTLLAKTDILHSAIQNDREVRYIQSCFNVRTNVDYVVENRPQVGLSYNVSHRTFVGLCGAMVVQKQGSNWKIVGLHVAGTKSGSVGYAAAMLPVDIVQDQGVVETRSKADRVYYTNTRSELKKSPLYGLFPVTHGPAVLSSNDKRLEQDVGPIVIAAADKYHNDVFEPCPNVFSVVKQFVTEKVVEAVGIHDSLNDYHVATNGLEFSNTIDMTTSAGPKYVAKRLTKKDLFIQHPDGSYDPTEELRNDCHHLLQAIKNNEAVVDFGTNTKDEIVKSAKIKSGRTRAVESCSVDYVLVYRDVMGKIYDRIYATPAGATGIAVGINPYTDYHEIYQNLRGKVACLDYTQFDGSLSYELMRHAVDVLAACHADPDLVIKLHKPVLDSRHLVGDEIWNVHGGMPSGSPCTSVLNSICNLLVVYSAMFASGFTELHELDVLTYGDDVLISTGDQSGDITEVVEYISEWFGMTATNASKTGTDITETLETMTFLKRHFRRFPGTGRVIGQLDLDSMKQKIMWCRGREQFKDQFQSFIEELALHGAETYDSLTKEIRARFVNVGVKLAVPAWKDTLKRVAMRVFE